MRFDPAPADPLTLLQQRVHEAEGRGRRAFALFQAVRHQGPLVWIVPSHMPELPMLRGLPQGVGERLHLLRPVGETDLLWCVEEALRAAPVGLVIAEPSSPMSLTVGRRFQLAAEAGGWGQISGWKNKDDAGYKKMLGLVAASLAPLAFHDVDGTCGSPEHCRCGACWVKPFETGYRNKSRPGK